MGHGGGGPRDCGRWRGERLLRLHSLPSYRVAETALSSIMSLLLPPVSLLFLSLSLLLSSLLLPSLTWSACRSLLSTPPSSTAPIDPRAVRVPAPFLLRPTRSPVRVQGQLLPPGFEHGLCGRDHDHLPLAPRDGHTRGAPRAPSPDEPRLGQAVRCDARGCQRVGKGPPWGRGRRPIPLRGRSLGASGSGRARLRLLGWGMLLPLGRSCAEGLRWIRSEHTDTRH